MFQDHYDSQLDRFKESFLTEAARCGRTEEVSSLIELGARIDWCPENEDTPLLAAVKNNHIDVVTILIANGADVNRKSEGGNNALHLGLTPFDVAVEQGFWALAQTLKNLSDTMIDSVSVPSDFSDKDEEDDQIRDRFLSRVPDWNEESSFPNEVVESASDLDDSNAVAWHHLRSQDLNEQLVQLREQNSLLRKAEETYKGISSEAEKAILILEEKCKELEKNKEDFVATMDSMMDPSFLSQKSIEDIELMEERIRQTLDHLVAAKVNKLSEQIENRSCVVCQVQNKTVLLMPCRHLCVCKNCSKNHQLILCPLCREKITERIDVYS